LNEGAVRAKYASPGVRPTLRFYCLSRASVNTSGIPTSAFIRRKHTGISSIAAQKTLAR